MTEEKIKSIFDRVYNYLPNPIFNRPIYCMKKGNFLFDVAESDGPRQFKLHDGTIINTDMWATVLEEFNGEYLKRPSLCNPIKSLGELNTFVENIIKNKEK